MFDLPERAKLSKDIVLIFGDKAFGLHSTYILLYTTNFFTMRTRPLERKQQRTWNPKTENRNPKPDTRYPIPETWNLKPPNNWTTIDTLTIDYIIYMPYNLHHTRTAVAIQFIEAICHSATWRSWILGYMRHTGIAKVVCRHFRKTCLLIGFAKRLLLTTCTN